MWLEDVEEPRVYLRIFLIIHCTYILTICKITIVTMMNIDVITNRDSYRVNCQNNIPVELNADITLSEVEDVVKK